MELNAFKLSQQHSDCCGYHEDAVDQDCVLQVIKDSYHELWYYHLGIYRRSFIGALKYEMLLSVLELVKN